MNGPFHCVNLFQILEELERLFLRFVSFCASEFLQILLLRFHVLISNVRDFQIPNDATTTNEGFAQAPVMV